MRLGGADLHLSRWGSLSVKLTGPGLSSPLAEDWLLWGAESFLLNRNHGVRSLLLVGGESVIIY